MTSIRGSISVATIADTARRLKQRVTGRRVVMCDCGSEMQPAAPLTLSQKQALSIANVATFRCYYCGAKVHIGKEVVG